MWTPALGRFWSGEFSMKESKSTLIFYKSLISSYKKFSQNEKKLHENKIRQKISSTCNLFSSFSPIWEEKKKIRKELGIVSDNNFNIFTSIAEYYWYENLHSDILKIILDPFTPIIGNPNFLKCFLEFIEIDPKTFNYQNASVERESEKIDLLIYDEKKAIIVENKINFAKDQQNQLPRYYEKITNPNGDYQKEVIKIVYLTLSNKKNPIFDYTEDYKHYIPIIKSLLTHVAAVNIPTNEFAASGTLSNSKSLLNQLIEIEKTENREIEKNTCVVYLQQYAQLLNYLGEQEIMSETNEKIAELMFKTEDSSEMTQDIVNIFNNRYEYLGNFCLEKIVKEDSSYEKINDGIIGKKLSENEYAYFAVEAENKNKVYSYGFYNKNSDWTPKDQKTFMSKMKGADNVQSGSEWIYKYLSSKELENEKELENLTVDKLEKYIKKLIEKLS